MNPKYSVIVPVYNSEATLSRCVDSILAQGYTDFELILVDDGSSDKSPGIIDCYAKRDSRVKILHKSNGGVSSARNAGLKISVGEWILFADSDDEILPDWIASFDAFSESYDMVVQGVYYRRKFNTWIKEIPLKSYVGNEGIREFVTELMMLGAYGYTFNKSFKKSILDKWHIEFDTDIHFREDELFVTQYLAHSNRLKTINSANYIYDLPIATKVYKGDPYLGLLLVFMTLDKIFNGEYNEHIAKIHLTNIKGCIVSTISSKKIPAAYEVDLYYRLLQHSGKRLFKEKIIDIWILTSDQSRFSRFLIKLIHKLAEKWEN